MLLSLPTWIIHLLTVSEWLAAMLLIERYARRIERPRLRLFAVAMLPHLLAGSLVLAFHASGDRAGWLLEASRVATFCGSLCLLAAGLLLLRSTRVPPGLLAGVVLVAGLFAGIAGWVLGDGMPSMLPLANLAYLAFLVVLVVVARQDPVLFSPITVFGFWFLLVFVAVTIATTHVATHRLGLASLSHADLLHGGSEALLSVSNFLIAFGAFRRLRKA